MLERFDATIKSHRAFFSLGALRGTGVSSGERKITLRLFKRKKRESTVPGLRRNGFSTFGNPKTTVSSPPITLAARGLEEWRNFEEFLTESVGHVHFS